MKSLRRYFCVLLSCVLLLGAFSVTANAEELETTNYHIFVEQYWKPIGSTDTRISAFTFYPNNGEQEVYTKTTPVATPSTGNAYDTTGRETLRYTLAYDDKSVIFYSGVSTKVTLENVYIATEFEDWVYGHKVLFYGNEPVATTAMVTYKDNSTEYIEMEMTNRADGVHDITFTFTPINDVVAIIFSVAYDYNKAGIPNQWYEQGGYYKSNLNSKLGEVNGDQSFILTVKQPSEEAGLLSGILGWIENIWNTVTDGFTDMKNGITNIVNKIIELPSLLWEKIETGLKNLFVPDDEYIVGYKDRWDELLADRLGAVYEVVNVTFESWDKINVSDATNTVDMPKVTIPLPDDEEFSFGGFPVKIVPDGFEVLVTACKLIVGIVCTIMFVNGLRKRYDEVMGVEQ